MKNKKRSKLKLVAFNLKTLEVKLFETKKDCVEYFKLDRFQVHNCIERGDLVKKTWSIKEVILRDGNINYRVSLTTTELKIALKQKIKVLNTELNKTYKRAVKNYLDRYYLLNSNLEILKVFTSYKEGSLALSIPMGSISYKLSKVFTIKNPTLVKASDYKELLLKHQVC